jgi:hypothetical protein
MNRLIKILRSQFIALLLEFQKVIRSNRNQLSSKQLFKTRKNDIDTFIRQNL